MLMSNVKSETLNRYAEDQGTSWYHNFLEKEATIEDIVHIIQQEDDEQCWLLLEKKTKKLFHFVFNKYIHNFYKENQKEDMYSIIKTGWVKAVKTYDPSKTTVGFVPYAAYIMRQHYQMFARRIKENRIGNSVRDELFSGTQIDYQDSNEKMASGCITNILKYECEEFDKIELSDFIKDKLQLLEQEDEIQHTFIKQHYIDGVSQKKLGEIYNMSQSAVSRKIRKGLAFLKNEIQFEQSI